MNALLSNRWLHLSAATLTIGVVVGVVVPLLVFSGGSQATSIGDRVMLTTGGTVFRSGGLAIGAFEEAFEEHLPLTGAAAVAAGWVDPVLCSPGRGKYFRRGESGDDSPYFLMYSTQDELIGVYLFSDNEMPAPWKRLDVLRGGGGVTMVDHEHWGMFVYFTDPTRACASADKTGGSVGGVGYSGAHAVRSYQAPPTPTATPAPALALEAIVAAMADLTSLSFIVTSGPDGNIIQEGIGADKVGAIVSALEQPVDSSTQWIDNRPHRGISGTVSRQALVALFPAAATDGNVAVQIWVDERSQVRRLQIEGAVMSDDAADTVRVLEPKDLGSGE